MHSNSEITSYLQDLPQDLLTFNKEGTGASGIERIETKQTTILSSNLTSGAKLWHKRTNAKIILGEQTLRVP
ncbi:MAG: hypothetical protein KAR21_22280 [Spirochaetales bacterium]|nr:hypothetical protein [Spirochaetales bacterium]